MTAALDRVPTVAAQGGTGPARDQPGTAGSARPEPGGTGPVGRRRLTPLFLLLPAGLASIVFFVLPLLTLAATSLMTGSLAGGFALTWHFPTYGQVLHDYWPQFARSFGFAATATVLAVAIAYPLAYTIAFKAGRWRSILLVLVVAPFFTSFLIRTLAWKQILADDGAVVSVMNATHLLDLTDALGITSDHRLLATPFAVVMGLTYNFLPFMVLPLYTSLEKIDRSLFAAAGDLYSGAFTTFRKITWPLSLPGVVGGTLMTFIPAAGDYVNAQLLGSTSDTMTGNVIDNQVRDFAYPAAAAMSIVLMVAIVLLVGVYVRRAGTEELV